MNIIDLNYGLFGTYLIANEIKCFGDLPELPKGYELPIINSNKDVQDALEQLKIKNMYIDNIYKDDIESNIISFELNEYESECFLVALVFNNIFDFWCGHIIPEDILLYDNDLVVEYELLEMYFWDYLKDKCKLEDLKEKSINFYKQYLLKAGM